MSDYVKTADYASKDALPTGDLSKVIRGTELGADFDAIAVAIATKYDSTDLNVTLQQYSADTVTLPSGTAMLFYQNLAPTGWTKVTTSALDNCALRIVSDGSASGGNGGVTGGTATFNAVFGNSKSTNGYTLTTSDIPSHNHPGSVTSTDGAHTHTYTTSSQDCAGSGGQPCQQQSNPAYPQTGSSGSHSHTVNVASQGGGGSHAHTLNFDVRYASFIVATKN